MKETTETEQTDSDRRGAEPLCGGHRAPLGLHLPDRAHPTSAALGLPRVAAQVLGMRLETTERAVAMPPAVGNRPPAMRGLRVVGLQTPIREMWSLRRSSTHRPTASDPSSSSLSVVIL